MISIADGTLTTDKNLDDMFEEGSAPSFAVFDVKLHIEGDKFVQRFYFIRLISD